MTDEKPEEPTLKGETKEFRKTPEVIPRDFPSVHIDKAMVGIDESADTATLTLLAMHIVPNIEKDGWGLENVRWEVVAEVKIPMPVLNALVVYYVQQISGGVNILPAIQKHLQEHPKGPPKTGITYGPTGIKQEWKPPETPKP